MSSFIGKMAGGEQPEKPVTERRKFVRSSVFQGDQIPDLAEALDVVLFYAMNSPTGASGVREVGEKVAILLPNVEVLAVCPKTGDRIPIKVGNYEITVARVA